eukprot:1338743-Amorphochlora_amoeboformis.AAC.1
MSQRSVTRKSPETVTQICHRSHSGNCHSEVSQLTLYSQMGPCLRGGCIYLLTVRISTGHGAQCTFRFPFFLKYTCAHVFSRSGACINAPKKRGSPRWTSRRCAIACAADAVCKYHGH